MFDRITFDSQIMAGRACIRGMRITVSLVLNLIASGMTQSEILEAYPYLEAEDIKACLQYAAFLADEKIPVMKLTSVTSEKRPPLFGSAKELISISDDFEAPLENFNNYM